MLLVSFTKITVMADDSTNDKQIEEVIETLEALDFESLIKSKLAPEIAPHVTIQVAVE